MRVGLHALLVSVRVTTRAEPSRGQVAATLAAIGGSALVLFVTAPSIAIGATNLHGITAAAAEAATRVAMLVVYLLLVSRSRGAAQLFRYHGAEHKTIRAFERLGRVPFLKEARDVGPIHDRCGTNFAMLFVLCAGVVYAIVPRSPLWVGALWRVVLVPLVGSLAYELMRLAAHEERELWARIVVWPGRAAQRLTTAEPGDDELDVAIAALTAL